MWREEIINKIIIAARSLVAIRVWLIASCALVILVACGWPRSTSAVNMLEPWTFGCRLEYGRLAEMLQLFGPSRPRTDDANEVMAYVKELTPWMSHPRETRK